MGPVMVTLAPETTASEGSRTTPLRLPLTDDSAPCLRKPQCCKREQQCENCKARHQLFRHRVSLLLEFSKRLEPPFQGRMVQADAHQGSNHYEFIDFRYESSRSQGRIDRFPRGTAGRQTSNLYGYQ